MPIPSTALERRLVPRVLTRTTTVAELLYLFAEQPEPHRCYAVVRVADQYAVVALNDLREFTDQHGEALLPLLIGGVDGLLRPGASFWQSQTGEDRARRELDASTRYRRVIFDDAGDIVGVLTATELSGPKGASPLVLIGALEAGALDVLESSKPPAPPHLNTRFDGVAPNAPLVVGRRVPLIISVGAPTATNAAQSSRPFSFDFAGVTEAVRFTVRVDADPEMWTVRVVEPTLIVAPPGTTEQEAEFTLIAKHPGRDKLHLSVERDGATIQHIWLTVVAAQEQAVAPPMTMAMARTEASLPLDVRGAVRSAVELVIQPGVQESFAVVQADLPAGMVRQSYRIPVSGTALQNATLRLRQELVKIVFYPGRQTREPQPFISLNNLTIDPATARKAYVPLADAGQQVWDMLFNAPRTPEGLKQLAADMRSLPIGSHFPVVLDSQEFIVPWALLYDKPGPINEETLAWEGFWGYRYILDVFPPGRYPAPTIRDTPLNLLLLLNNDTNLRSFTTAQEQFARQKLNGAQTEVAWGHAQVEQMLRTPPGAALVYCYCHGDHESGAVTPTALASESALFFSSPQRMRLADLRRLPAAPITSRPLVFVNACEGATQDAFYYDGFMPFFIEQQLARGFIGTEVKAPIFLAHDLALNFLRMFGEGQPVGEIFWQLRRHYLDTHNNILAFNYSLYCPAEVRLATPLIQ